MELVNEWGQIEKNLLVLNKYRHSTKGLKYYSGLIQRGKKIVVFNENGKLFFGPSRFIGYIDNNMNLHGSNDKKDGGITNNAIIKLLGNPVESEELEKEYIKLCNELEINIHQTKRMYWYKEQTSQKDTKKLLKKVGKSQFSDGVRINKEFHELFNPKESEYYVGRGSAREIKVLFNNKVFDAEYRYEGQFDKNVELQRIGFRKELKEEFENVFPELNGEFYIEQGIDLNHFIFSHIAVTIEDDDPDNDIEYAEGKEYYRLHRLRERKSGVVKQAKKLFVKKHGRLFCEVCLINFSMLYGERGKDFIEGHHKKLVSEMKEGDKTKAGDIAMLCSNCHRMIHKKPIVTVEELAMIVNGLSNYL